MKAVFIIIALFTSLLNFYSCSLQKEEESKVLAHEPISIDDLSSAITVGPEFEFDHVNGKQAYSKEEALAALFDVSSNINESLQKLSIASVVNGPLLAYKFNSNIVSEFGIERALFSNELGFNTVSQRSDFHSIGKLTYYTLTLMPSPNNELLSQPIKIMYTKDDVILK